MFNKIEEEELITINGGKYEGSMKESIGNLIDNVMDVVSNGNGSTTKNTQYCPGNKPC